MITQIKLQITQIIVLFVSALILLFTPALLAQTIDRIIAVVNNEIITQSDVNRVVAAIEVDPGKLKEKLNEIKENIINQMIEEKLILCEAKRVGIKIDEFIIDEHIEEVKEKFPSEEEFEKALAAQELTLKNLRDRFCDQEIMKKAVEYFVKFEIKVDPIEIRQFYQSHKSQLLRPEKAHLKSILIKVDSEQDKYKALQKAKVALGRLKKGGSFEKISKIYSQAANAEDGGNLGFVERGQLIKEIDETVFVLEPGEFSDVIKTNQGYRIFKLEEKKPEQPLSFSEAQDEIRQILYNRKFTQAFKKWIDKLKQDAYIVIEKGPSDEER